VRKRFTKPIQHIAPFVKWNAGTRNTQDGNVKPVTATKIKLRTNVSNVLYGAVVVKNVMRNEQS
jgi:hypothetical protein